MIVHLPKILITSAKTLKIKGANLSKLTPMHMKKRRSVQCAIGGTFHDQPLIASYLMTMARRRGCHYKYPYNCVSHSFPCESKSKFSSRILSV